MQKAISSKTYDQFRDWLKDSRIKRNLTIRQLAVLLGKHASVVGKIETGQRRLDVYEYCQYCDVLDLDPNEGLKILRKGHSR